MADKMRRASLVKNYIYYASNQVLNLIAPLITAPYISRVLGAEKIGIYSYTASITTYFITFAILGSEGYARRETAYQKENREGYSKLFWEICTFRATTTLIALLVFAFVIWKSDYKLLFLAQGISILSVAADITWLFQGLEEFSSIALRNFVFRLITIIGIFVLVRGGEDLLVYAFLLAGLTFTSNVYLCFVARKFIGKISFSKLEVRKHFTGIAKLFIPTIAVSMYAALDKTMLGIIAPDMFQSGYYEQAEKMVKMCIVVVNALGFVIAPKIAEEFLKNNRSIIKEYMKRAYQFIWLLTFPMMFGLYAVADMIIPWFYGSGYQDVIPVIRGLAALIPIVSFSSLTGVQYLISTKKESFWTISLFVGAFVNFVCNLILIPWFYALGAAMATIIGEGCISISQMLYIVAKERLLTLGEIFAHGFTYLFFSIIMFIIVFVIKASFGTYTIANTAFTVAAGGAMYFFLLCFNKDAMVMEMLKRLKRRGHMR